MAALHTKILFLMSLCLATTTTSWAFLPPQPTTIITPHHHHTTTTTQSTSSLNYYTPTTPLIEPSSSQLLSVETLDPTTVLSDALGGLLGSSAILLVPIVAALSVAGLIAFLIVSYANPEDED